MYKKHTFLAVALVLVMLVVTFIPALAQTPATDGVITLAQLQGSEIFLNGPYDSKTVYFGLPAEWALTSDAQLDLNLTTSFSAAAAADAPAASGGLLTVRFNRITVAILPLSALGTSEASIAIPAANLVSPRSDGRMELKLELDSGISCQANQHMNVVINQNTKLSFNYEDAQPNTDLINFPRPIFQNSIYPDSALIVIPDSPTSAEMQAALSVAAGLGNLTSSQVALDLVTASQLTEDQKAASHLIFIGKAASLPQLADLNLPLAASGGTFASTGGDDDGVVEMVNSPWSVTKVALVVSGNSDAGVVKAAQAISTGVLQSNAQANVAVIQSVQDSVSASPLAANQTLADLGYAMNTITSRGVNSAGYNFYVPAGSTVSQDAYFELSYGHSALLDYNLSGLVVLLNGQPIGSIRFSEVSAAEAINATRFKLPQTLILPGTNRLEVRVSLEPVDNCTDPSLESLFAVIWPESRLYLPFTTAQINTLGGVDLTAYPAPFSFDSSLGSLAFVLQNNDLTTWQAAIQVAKFLGDRSNGAISMPAAFLDGTFSASDVADYNLIVLGKPSKMAFMTDLNQALPVPFDMGNDQANSPFIKVTYRIPTDVPQGYVQLLNSPWNADRIVIAGLGNTPESVAWAASSLADSPLRGRLAGNFAIINRTQVQTADTRTGQVIEPIAPQPTIESPAVNPPAALDLTPPPSNQPSWLLPALFGSGGLAVLILLIALINGARRSRNG